MEKTYRRLVFAAILSASVYLITYYWYQATSPHKRNNENEKPVAYVSNIENEVQKRPAARLVWQSLNMGENIFPGEAIRTSEQGDIRIQFHDSSRYLDIEPESLIVIKISKNEISLDLEDGSLFVGQDTQTKEGEAEKDSKEKGSLVLTSKEGKVDLSRATASLSRTKGKDLNLKVLKGSAQVQKKDGKTEEIAHGASSSMSETGSRTPQSISQHNIEIISPELGKPVVVNSQDLDPISFKWKSLSNVSTVQLWVGPSRKKLDFKIETQKLEQNQLEYKMIPGSYYWKLVAVDNNRKEINESGVNRLVVSSRFPPVPIEPQPESKIVLSKQDSATKFSWQIPDEARSIYLEIGSDPLLSKKIFTKNFLNETQVIQNLKPDTYYWRLSAHYEGIAKPFSSAIFKFQIADPIEEKKPPIVIQWTPLKETQPQYFTEKPQIHISWISDQKERVKKWRISVKSELLPTDIIRETEQNNIDLKLDKEGLYIATVEALDEHQNVLSVSSEKVFESKPLPLIPSPILIPEGKDLEASTEGTLSLQWTSVDTAKEYQLSVISSDGKELSSKKFSNATQKTSIQNMLPGEYGIKIFALDNLGRTSQQPEIRKARVPASSGLKAPKLKGVKVK